MIGESLSKVAIVVTFAVLAHVGWINGVAAALLAALGFWLSFLRDCNLRRRGIVRRLPTLGWVWVLSLTVATLLIGAIRLLTGVEFLAAPAVVLMAGLVAMGVRLLCIFVDGAVDWISTIVGPLIGSLEQRFPAGAARHSTVAQAQRAYSTMIPEPHYSSFVPPMNWRYQCPRCGARVEHKIDICWNCNYGADVLSNSP